MLQHPLSPDIPQAFKGLMLSLSVNLTKLKGRNRDRADGILKTIERTTRVTEKQQKEVVRLEKLARRERRPTKFYGYRDGATYVSPKEAEKKFEAERRHEDLYARDPLYRAEYDRTQSRARGVIDIACSRMAGGHSHKWQESEYIRNHMRHYRRDVDLAEALPREILMPHLMPRRQLVACLLKRLRLLRAEGIPPTIAGRSEALHRIHVVRSCLIAEGLAMIRDRMQARLLQEAI